MGRCLLQRRLDERKLSRREFSQRTGLSEQRISDIARKRFVLTLPNARFIAQVLGCTIDDLYEWLPSGED
ncbi:helix-turn-helix transcriptional regulator [uncultured Planococcus sp.]|uniref:helix-turn-helix domain-containing protein n=1 Tax=uncultured Planococcus sp. TaxID=337815 RepID=UPI002628C265|nr:helix-turn-helix transcriptional regulator [uncultured Planococcus sp.]